MGLEVLLEQQKCWKVEQRTKGLHSPTEDVIKETATMQNGTRRPPLEQGAAISNPLLGRMVIQQGNHPSKRFQQLSLTSASNQEPRD